MIMSVVAGWQQLATLVAGRGRPMRDEQGASIVEYALLVALIAIVCVVAIQFLGTTTSGGLSNAGSYLNP